jgi:hypothetical protein
MFVPDTGGRENLLYILWHKQRDLLLDDAGIEVAEGQA